MRPLHRTVVLLLCIVPVPSSRGASPQVIVSREQRVSVSSTSMYVGYAQLDPEINEAGQVAVATELTFYPPSRPVANDERDPIEGLILFTPKKGAQVIVAAESPLPGFRDRTIKEFRSVRLSQDGSVLFDATLASGSGKKKARDEPLSLWLWREGKLHLLLVDGEGVEGQPRLAKINKWDAVVANDGRVAAVVVPEKGGSNPSLVLFKDGKVEETFIGHDAEKNQPGVSFGPSLHAVGDNIIVVQKIPVRSGLGGSRISRIDGTQLKSCLTARDTAPEHILGTLGGDEQIGSMEDARVTASGRVLAFTKPGTKKSSGLLQAILATDENFGAPHAIAMMGNKRTYPQQFHFQNLLNEPERACLSEDGFVAFTDPNEQNKALYLADPSGKLDRFATLDELPGLKGAKQRTVWSMAVAKGGVVAIEIIADHGEHTIFSYDAKRGVRRVVGKGFGLPDNRGELQRLAIQKSPRSAMTSDGRYVFAWDARVGATPQPGGIAVVDLKK